MSSNFNQGYLLNHLDLRFYLIFDSDASSANAIINSFNDIGDFECAGVVETGDFQLHEILEFQPELVLINLDAFWHNQFEIIEKLNKSLGIPPNYIGITSCSIKGLKAFKNGFMDVIEEPQNSKTIFKILTDYKTSGVSYKFYCISYYYDFQYVLISDIILLKADGYTTEIIMRDGSCFTNFKTLKNSHLQLPFNFQRIHKSFVINSYYVSRIHIGRREIYLRNWDGPLPLSNSFLSNITNIKKLLTDARNTTF